jgi:hypothetical protein
MQNANVSAASAGTRNRSMALLPVGDVSNAMELGYVPDGTPTVRSPTHARRDRRKNNRSVGHLTGILSIRRERVKWIKWYSPLMATEPQAQLRQIDRPVTSRRGGQSRSRLKA